MDDYGTYLQPDQSWPPRGHEDDFFYIKESGIIMDDLVFDSLDEALEYLDDPSSNLVQYAEYIVVNNEDNSHENYEEWYKDEDNTIWWRAYDASEDIEGEMVWTTNSDQIPREMYYYDNKVWIRYDDDEIWNDEDDNEMLYYEGRFWTRYIDDQGDLPEYFTTDDITGPDEMDIADDGTKWFRDTADQYWTDNDGNYMIHDEDTDMTWYRNDDDRFWNDNGGNLMFYNEVTDTMWYPYDNHEIWVDDEENEAYYDGHTMWYHDDQPAHEQDPDAKYWVDNGGDKMWIDYDDVKWYYDGDRFWNREDGIEWFEFGNGTKLYYPHPTRPPTEDEYGNYFPHYYTK